MMRRVFCALVLLFASAFSLHAGPRAADRQSYGDLVRQGHEALQAGQKGLAALCYERASVQSDASPVVRHNLETLRRDCGADRYEIETHPLVRLVFFMYYYCARSDLIGMMYFATLFLLAAVGVSTLTGRKIAWLTNLVYGAAIVFIVLSCGVYLYREREAQARDRAVVVARALLYARPDTREQALTLLAETCLVRVVQRADGLCRIVLPSGVSGWLSDSAIAMINE